MPLPSLTLNRNNDRPMDISQNVSPHPYIHDQLHILHRSARSFSTNSLPDPSYFGDVTLCSSANKVIRRINAAPSRIFDASELVNNYYLNLISWGKDNALVVALANACIFEAQLLVILNTFLSYLGQKTLSQVFNGRILHDPVVILL